MNIGFLSSSTGWGGLERNLLRYARWMSEEGHQSHCFIVPSTPIEKQARAEGQACHAIRRHPRYFPWRSAWLFSRRLKRLKIEVLWVRDPRDLAFAGLSAQWAGIPLIFQQGMQLAAPKRSVWHRMRFRRVTCWVSPTHGLAEQALDWTPLSAHQIHCIPLALEDEWFSATKRKLDPIDSLEPEKIVVGLFGRFAPLKGQADLLRALPLAPQVQVWFIGESTPNEAGDFLQELIQLSEELGVSERVRFEPPKEDLMPCYDALDAFAMCSASETFGMVTLEALSRGIYVIGTDAGGTSELLNGQPGTKLIPPGDHHALAKALNAVPSKSRWIRNLAVHTRRASVDQWSALLSKLCA